MKYEVPEINISKFAVENVVTLSAVGKVENALKAAGFDSADSVIIRSSIDEWVAAN